MNPSKKLMLALPGLLIPQVSNAAHAGGLIGGVLVGLLVGVRQPPGVPTRRRTALAASLAVGVMASGIAAGMWRAWFPGTGGTTVTLSTVQLTAPAGTHIFRLDDQTAVWKTAFVAVHLRRWRDGVGHQVSREAAVA